ncbi:MAG: glycine--tRNA ligase subunit beta, partial [Pseudomonadota bacterium]
MPDLLIELFSEEIPARMQARAAEDLRHRICAGLEEAGLTFGPAQAFATPRRLALSVIGLDAASPTTHEERRGPRIDAPEKAIEGFLRGAGVAREDLQLRDDKKGQVYVAQITRQGRPAADIVAEVLAQTVQNFPWPKSMRWGGGSLRWVRPLHRILCILSESETVKLVPVELEGVSCGDTTEGHRFMAPDEFSVVNIEDYTAKLMQSYVILDPEERAEKIETAAQALSTEAGMDLVADPGLLREVAGLVEWPVALIG